MDAEEGASNQKDILLDKIASCQLKLGLNYHECEEASVSIEPAECSRWCECAVQAGARLIETAIERLEARDSVDELQVTRQAQYGLLLWSAQHATNYLGIIWCELGNVDKAAEYLHRSKAV